ncbi:MAG: Mur ligase family protein, partial [Steroidobacteraceae bacterium]
MSSLEQWLAYQSQVHPQAIDLGLDRLRQVLDRLGWRQPRVPVITVAGTNGKGSVSGYCTAIMAAAGYRVGTFTSPHLRDYRERISIHDRLVSAEELVSAFERIEAARGAVGLTFFEFNTLAALLTFEAAQLDAWVLEIGMGGRLDAVNVVDPDVAVVVSIGLDHQEYLGTTLEAIAREKAGIFRSGRPAVLGGDMPAIVEDTARNLGAPLKRLGCEYSYDREDGAWCYRGNRWNLPQLPPPALAGGTQYANAATALAALEEIDARLSIPAAAVAQGLRRVRLVARFQIVAPADPALPTWILDVAHNPAAARVLASNLREHPIAGRTLAVCGILTDKDAAGVAAELRDSID